MTISSVTLLETTTNNLEDNLEERSIMTHKNNQFKPKGSKTSKQQQQQQQKQQQQQQQQQHQKQQQESSTSSSPDDKYQEEIASLRAELKELRERMEVVESQAAITAQVNATLAKEIDRLEQYGRRNSLVIRGIPPNKDETNKDLKENVRKIVAEELGMPKDFGHDFDKTHRIGPVLETDKGPRQDVIVRFKSHSTRYNVYLKRKDVKSKNIRITPSLTSKRRKLLSQAQEHYRNHPDVNFIYVSIHGDVKVRFHNKFRGRFVHDIDSMDQLHELMEAPDDEDKLDNEDGEN